MRQLLLQQIVNDLSAIIRDKEAKYRSAKKKVSCHILTHYEVHNQRVSNTLKSNYLTGHAGVRSGLLTTDYIQRVNHATEAPKSVHFGTS